MKDGCPYGKMTSKVGLKPNQNQEINNSPFSRLDFTGLTPLALVFDWLLNENIVQGGQKSSSPYRRRHAMTHTHTHTAIHTIL